MRFYAKHQNGKLICIGTGEGGTEITEAEYNELLNMIQAKATLVDQLYNGDITISDVPVMWQEEIQRRVNEQAESIDAEEGETQDEGDDQ